MTFCPSNPDKYCPTPTIGSRRRAIEDWILLFDAVIRLQPSDIKASATITHSMQIRDIAESSLKNLYNLNN